MPLALGVDQLDRGLRLRGQQPADHAAVGGRDGVLDEVPLDAPARVEDVDQELAARNGGHAREVGADLAPFAIVAVALGALLLEDQLAAGGIAPFLELGREPIDHLLPIGVGQAAALLEQLLGTRGDLAVGVGRQGLLLVERQLGEPGRVVLERLDERRDPVGAAEQGPARPAIARRETSLGKTATNALPT